MKKTLIAGLLSLSVMAVSAQDLPKPSPLCTVTQAVGLHNLTLEYSRPSVKGRTIFGDLVPNDKVWRLGANAPTMITTDRELIFGDEIVKPGKYAIFVIPHDRAWVVVFNTDVEQWGAGDYDEAKNVATVKVKTLDNPFTESLSITIEDISSAGGSIDIAWEKTKVKVPFTINTDKAAMENIEKAIKEGKDLDKVYSNAAGYFRDSKKDLKSALEYVDKSIKVKEGHANLFLKARILQESGKKEEAIKMAETALTLAKKADAKGYVDYISENLEKWKK